jgi:hypothetical protein
MGLHTSYLPTFRKTYVYPNTGFDVGRSRNRSQERGNRACSISRTSVGMLAAVASYVQGEFPVFETQPLIATAGFPRGRKHDLKSRRVCMWRWELFHDSLRVYVGPDVLTLTVMKTCVSWYTTPCSLLKVNWRFVGICHFQLCFLPDSGLFFLGLLFDPEDGGGIPPKRRLALNGLHGVITQKV